MALALTDLFNAALAAGVFPERWKTSWVVALYKGKGPRVAGRAGQLPSSKTHLGHGQGVRGHMRSCANQCFLCVIFLETQCHFLGFGPHGRFLAGNAIFGYVPPTFKKNLVQKLGFRFFFTTFVRDGRYFCSFSLFSFIITSIYKGNMKENQGNEQKMRPNRTKVVRKI